MTRQLFLKPNEEKFIAMAVLSAIDLVSNIMKDQKLNWTPESRKDMKEMLEAGNGLKIKMKKLGFDMRELPPFLESDIDEFFTKES